MNGEPVDLLYLFFFGLVTAMAMLIAWRKGFFIIPHTDTPPFLSLKTTLTAICVYFGGWLIFPWLMSRLIPLAPSAVIAFVFSTSLLVVVAMLGWVAIQPSTLRKKIWCWHTSPIQPRKLAGVIAAALVLSFLTSEFLGNLFGYLFAAIWGIVNFADQIAVSLVYMASNKLQLLLVFLLVVVVAPLAEELLFRGFIQNYLRRYLSPWRAIMLAAFAFALIHFHLTQGIYNWILLSCLWVVGLFLGFIYERQATLWAPIALHSLLNLVNMVGILITG